MAAMTNATLFFDAQALLRPLLEARLQTLPPPLRADVARTLKEKGSLLAASSSSDEQQQPPFPAGVWALLTLLVAQVLTPDVDLVVAGSVAVAVECEVQALDILDDIMDDDLTPAKQEMGRERMRKVATALLTLARQEVLALEKAGTDAGHILLLLGTIEEATMEASAGQHRDLLAEARAAEDLTDEECLQIAAAKGGVLFRLACRLGAECARAEAREVELFAQLGLLLGTAAQLDSDCRDLYTLLQENPADTVTLGVAGPVGTRSDLQRAKKTLPVVLAARAIHAEQGDTGTGVGSQLPRSLLLEQILTTSGIARVYYERVREAVQEFERERGPLSPALRALLLPTEV
jgi:geranylgeranyl pyrophosphate synthase